MLILPGLVTAEQYSKLSRVNRSIWQIMNFPVRCFSKTMQLLIVFESFMVYFLLQLACAVIIFSCFLTQLCCDNCRLTVRQ